MGSNNPVPLLLHGKGDKERIVAITDKTAKHLQLYMGYYHTNMDERTESLFYTVINGQIHTMSPGNVGRLINKYADIVRTNHPNLPVKGYPHMFRRTRATNLYQDGVELELVSRILGHSSTQATRIYATPSIEMLREAMDNQTDYPPQKPLWEGKEEELARFCGLR